jgi:putative hydrolase of the HAD superfamily
MQNSKRKTEGRGPPAPGSQPPVPLKGVLFDLGSTLQEFRHEDWDAIVAALNRDLYRYIASRGQAHRLPPLDAFLELVGTSVQAHRSRSASSLRSHSMLDVLSSVFEQHGIEGMQAQECLLPWYGRLTDLIYIEPDVEPALRLLRDGGLKLGLVSNTSWPSATHDRDLERFGIKHLLECRLYSCEVGWEKPAPQIFEEALGCLGLPAEQVAFVGDFLRYDVAGAQAVGMKGIWKRVANRPQEVDDHTVVPDATIARIGELPAALEKLYGWRP